MKRILVVGCPGSGKSTLSRALSSYLGIEICHLDMLFWNADKTHVTRDVFLERLSRELEKDELIIDGNYDSSLEMRFLWCDTVFFLDLPCEVCLESVRARWGKPREDMPWIETEEDPGFMEYVASFGREHRPIITELIEKYKKDAVVFTSREEVNEYIGKMKKGSP